MLFPTLLIKAVAVSASALTIVTGGHHHGKADLHRPAHHHRAAQHHHHHRQYHPGRELRGTRRAVYLTMRHQGLSRSQATGIMGNIEHESSFNPETNVMDSNGARSYGLISWNAASYPHASSLVTGHPSRDIRRQVRFLVHGTNNSSLALHGHSAAQIGGRWAEYVEVCRGCAPGGNQFNERTASASAYNHEAKGSPRKGR